MTNDDICITTSLQKIQNLVKLSDIPNISNSTYSVKLEDPGKGLFALKKATDKSIIELLDEPNLYGIAETDAAWARAWYMNLYKNTQIPSNLLKCFTDKNFTGLILCGLPVTVIKKEAFGISAIIEKTAYTALLIQATNVTFTSDAIDVSGARLYGWLNGDTKDCPYEYADTTFCFDINQTQSLVSEAEILYSSISCEIQLNQLFSSATTMSSSIQLLGIYQQLKGMESGNRNYSFPDTSTFVIDMNSGFISSIEIEHIVTEMKAARSEMLLTMRCSGVMKFTPISDEYDLFSYGDETDGSAQGGLLFQNLQIRFDLKEDPSDSFMSVDYRNITFSDKGSMLRKNSFASQFKHECPGFVSYQSGITPEQMKYSRILTPFSQKRLGSTWYGITMKITVFGSLELELIFAFDDTKLYIGNRMGKTGSNTFYNITTTSPFKIQMKSIMLQLMEEAGKKRYGLLFKGVQASIFGLSVPEGNCNLLLSEDGKGKSAWYAVYGNRRKGGTNGKS